MFCIGEKIPITAFLQRGTLRQRRKHWVTFYKRRKQPNICSNLLILSFGPKGLVWWWRAGTGRGKDS